MNFYPNEVRKSHLLMQRSLVVSHAALHQGTQHHQQRCKQ